MEIFHHYKLTSILPPPHHKVLILNGVPPGNFFYCCIFGKLFTSLPYPDEVTADIVQKTIDKIIVRSKEDAETHFLCEEHFTLLWRLYKETDK